MSELKRGWRTVRFGDVVRQIKSRVDPLTSGLDRYVAGEHMDTDDLRIRRWGIIGDGDLGPAFHIRFRPGHVLYGSRRTYLRKVALADFEGICANTTFVLESADPQILLPELLPFVMRTEEFHEHSKRESKGSVNPYVNFSDLATYEFALPPLEEQRLLATRLNAVHAASERWLEAASRLNRVRSAALLSLYRNGCRGEPLRGTPVGPLPVSWSVEPLGSRFEVQLGKMMSKQARAGNDHVPYLRNANVQWNRLDLEDVATMSFTATERDKFGLRYGDIVACEGRHVGKSAIWRDEIPGACYQKALHRLRAKADDVPEYLLHCLYYYSMTGRFSAQTGETTIPHLPAERFRAMLFPFAPREEQVEVAERIGVIDRSMHAIQARIDASRTLFLGVLGSAGLS